MERALLVAVKLDSEKDNWEIEDTLAELEELVSSARAQAVDAVVCQRDKPTPNFFIGKGKTEEIAVLCQQENIDTVIFSRDLSGTQQRNLEEVIGKKTIDRTQLILDIFARHARTPEGKMQVELAQLQYLLPRLVGKGVMLSRLGGGIGTRGPGEQKLEVDRRQIRRRIEKLKSDLKEVRLHHSTLRKRRRENALPQVALIGYTNAGKSTLLNALTQANQVVADSLFTTLDPLTKSLKLPNGENIVISDTVGFLHRLPYHLIEAFRATLEEVQNADLLVYLLDASHQKIYEHHQAVMEILKILQADKKPIITLLNKTDLLEDKVWLGKLERDFAGAISISAKFKDNLDALLGKIQENFSAKMVVVEAILPHSRMDLVDLCYRQGRVIKIKYLQKGIKIKANLPRLLYHNLLHNREIEIQ